MLILFTEQHSQVQIISKEDCDMRKTYEEPEIQIRSYALPSRDVVMTSDINAGSGTGGKGDLEDGNDYDYFG